MRSTLSHLIKGFHKEQVADEGGPGSAAQFAKPAFRSALARVLVRMASAEGDFNAAEVERIGLMFQQITGEPFDKGTDQAEISSVIAGFGTVKEDVKAISGALDETGKEFMLRLAIMVAATDRMLHGDELNLARDLAAALGVPKERLDTIIREETAP